MADRNSLLKIARQLKRQIADLDLFDELNTDDHPISSTPSDAEKKRKRKEALQKRKQLAKVMSRIKVKSSSGGGRAAAALDSRRGGVSKSLLSKKIIPKT